MKLYLFLLILCVASGNLLYAQRTISGTVTDAKTGIPVSSVNIGTGQGQGLTATGQDGNFTLPVSRFPLTLRFTHIAYEPKTVTLGKYPEKPLAIILEPRVESIREVVIEGGKYNQVLRRENFYVNDYEFDQNKIWVVGYAGKSILKPQLILLDLDGHIIGKQAITGHTNLYKDAFGRVHLLDKSSITKVDYRDSQIMIDSAKVFSGWEQNLFDLQMVLGKSGIFKWVYNNGLYCEYAVVLFGDTTETPTIIHQAYDREIFKGKDPAKGYHHGSIPTIDMGSFGMGNNTSGGSGDSRNNASFDPSDAFTAMSQDQFFKYRPVKTHIFRYRNSFLIFEDKGCHLWKFDLAFTDPQDLRIAEPKDARNTDLLQDPVTGNLYLYYTILGYGYLAGVDPFTGAIQFTRKLEDYYRAENLKIYNNRAWFTHQSVSGSALMNLFSTDLTGN